MLLFHLVPFWQGQTINNSSIHILYQKFSTPHLYSLLTKNIASVANHTTNYVNTICKRMGDRSTPTGHNCFSRNKTCPPMRYGIKIDAAASHIRNNDTVTTQGRHHKHAHQYRRKITMTRWGDFPKRYNKKSTNSKATKMKGWIVAQAAVEAARMTTLMQG